MSGFQGYDTTVKYEISTWEMDHLCLYVKISIQDGALFKAAVCSWSALIKRI